MKNLQGFRSFLSLLVLPGLLLWGPTPAAAADLIKCAYPYWFGFAPTMVAATSSPARSPV